MKVINIYVLMMLCSFSLHSFAVDVEFTGELMDSPCILDPDSTDIDVTLRDIPMLNMNYLPGTSAEVPFQIKFINCDISQSNTMSIYFSGDTEGNMGSLQNKFLKVTGSNEGKIGLGILNTEGEPVTISGTESGYQIEISSETVVLDFSAYIKSTPDALESKSVVADNYSASATFEVHYE